MTVPALPPEVTHGAITGRVLGIIADTSADADVNPDTYALPDLSVTIKAAVSAVQVPSGKLVYIPMAISLRVDNQGYLRLPHHVQPDGSATSDAEDEIRLVATDNPAQSQIDWAYTMTIASASGAIRPIAFSFHVEGGTVQDLSELIPVAVVQGVQIMRGEVGPPPELVEGTTTDLPPESSATFELTETAPGVYRVDVGLKEGQPGAPGGSDAATAGFITDGVDTPAALAASPVVASKVTDQELMFNVARFGAVADGTGAVGVGTDSGPAFLAAIAAADAAGGGTILVPRGYYRSSVTIATDHRIVGDGQGYGNDIASAATLIAFDNDTDGVILTQRGSEIRNIYLRGGGTTGIGLRLGDIACQAYNVTIHGFGSHGLAAIDDATYPNVNHSFVDNVMVRACGGNGVHVTGPSDSNAGRFMNLNVVGNVGWGIYCAQANRNWFQGHLAANGNGIFDDGNSNSYDVYIESGSGTPFKLGSTSKYGRITVPNYAGFALDVADAASPAWQTWTFEENAGRRVLWLYDATQGPTPTTGKTWRVDSGGTSAGALSFYNVTDNAQGIRLTATDVFLNGNLRPFTTAAKDVGTSSAQWRNGFFSGYVRVGAVATGSRPSAATAGAGAMMFDTTLGKPIWSTGSAWVLADGTTA